MELKEVPWDGPMADDALETLSEVQKNLPYVIANTIGYALGKLSIWEEAEQEGLIIKLPCRIGAKIYEANHNYGKILQRIATKEDMLTKIKPGWGNRYFGSPEEAEKALKEAKGEH